jgi:hypothetical protein
LPRVRSPERFVPHIWPHEQSRSSEKWSEWQDLKLRPPRPERGALPAALSSSHLFASVGMPPSISRGCAGACTTTDQSWKNAFEGTFVGKPN